MLVACAVAPGDARLGDAIQPLLGAGFRWDRFARGAVAARIRPQVIAFLGGSLAGLPQAREVHDPFAALAQANAGHALFLEAELAAAAAVLDRAGVAALPFKGPAFAERIGTGPALREMDDLDLLLPCERVADAVEALAQLGYDSSVPVHALDPRWLRGAGHELALTRWRDGMLLELQWRLAPPWYPEPCTVAEALAQASPTEFRSGRMAWPRAEHLFLMHVADGMKSCGGSMRWAGDLAAIVRRHGELAWDEVRDIAARNGALDSVRVGLGVAQRLCAEVAARLGRAELALDLPPPALAIMSEGPRDARVRAGIETVVSRIATDGHRPGAIDGFRWAMRTADRPASAIAAVLRYLSGPAMPDLRAMPPPPRSAIAVRMRAARRRLGLGT